MKKDIDMMYITPEIEMINIVAEQVFATSFAEGSHSDFTQDDEWTNTFTPFN